MRKGIMFLCSLLFIGIADCMSQKKPLDMEAYKLWRRVEGQQMSEDGKWVTYRFVFIDQEGHDKDVPCLLYTSPSPRDRTRSRMPSSA